MTVTPLGDSAVVISLGPKADRAMASRVQALAGRLRDYGPEGVVDIVPAFASIALYLEPGRLLDPTRLWEQIRDAASRTEAGAVQAEQRLVEIPVCYGGEHGPDLPEVASRTGLSPQEVVARHCGAEYFVQAIGFAPGFSYLGGLPEELVVPRRATPRPRVARGSVGIGGSHTGAYPQESPGGWNLIGRTPATLFDVTRAAPALLQTGDRVQFRPVPAAEFAGRGEVGAGGEPPGPGLRVVRAGMHTTVQDLGRTGWRSAGVPLSGAADTMALRVANLLVGNPESAAGLEVAQVGPEIHFPSETVVALGGAEFEGIPSWQPVRVAAGETLRLGVARRGCRGCLAIAGGIAVESVLGSRSTYARAGFGGWRGRWLRDGDILPLGPGERRWRGKWWVDPRIVPPYAPDVTVRVVAGVHAAELSAGWRSAAFRVSRQSDRMGVRLEGERLRREGGAELTSIPVVPGTVQVPPDGQPIVLLADAQTIGGYPQLAHVITVDLPLIAQLRSGDTVRFREVPLDEARALAAARERAVGLLREGAGEKWR